MAISEELKQVLTQCAQQFLYYKQHRFGCPARELGECHCGLQVVLDAIKRQINLMVSNNPYSPSDMPGEYLVVVCCTECAYVDNQHDSICSYFSGTPPTSVEEIERENAELEGQVFDLQAQVSVLEVTTRETEVATEAQSTELNSRFGFVAS